MAVYYNVNITGSLTNTDGVLSGFSTSDFASNPIGSLGTDDFEIVFKIHTDSIATEQAVWNIRGVDERYPEYSVEIYQGKLYFETVVNATQCVEIQGTTTLATNTDYLFKITRQGYVYTAYTSADNGTTWVTEGTDTDSTAIPYSNANLYLGIYIEIDNGTIYRLPNLGTIDLNGCYIKINGVTLWQGATTISGARTTIQLRRDTASNWSTVNPTLAEGEVGLELDTGKSKVGDGVTAWNSLGYTVNQTYDSTSAKAQSGIAIANKLANGLFYETTVYPTYYAWYNSSYNHNGIIYTNTSTPTTSSKLYYYYYSDGTIIEIDDDTISVTNLSGDNLTVNSSNYGSLVFTRNNDKDFYIVNTLDTNGNHIGLNVADKTLSNVTSISNNSAVQTALNGKQNALGYTPVNKAGDTMSGGLTAPTLTATQIGIGSISLKNITSGNFSDVTFYDNNNVRTGFVRGNNISATENSLQLSAVNKSDVVGATLILINNNGTPSANLNTGLTVNSLISNNSITSTTDINLGGAGRMNLKVNGTSKGTTPSSNCYQAFLFNDTDSSHTTWQDMRFGAVETQVLNTGENRMIMSVYRNQASSTAGATMTLGITSAGTAWCTFPNTICVDGQWIVSSSNLASNVSLAIGTDQTLEYDLSSYLPNDSYKYEVLVSVDAQTGNSSGAGLSISLKGKGTSDGSNLWHRICNIYARGSWYMNIGNHAVVPIGTDRKLVLNYTVAGKAGTLNGMFVEGYRRIGTNS